MWVSSLHCALCGRNSPGPILQNTHLQELLRAGIGWCLTRYVLCGQQGGSLRAGVRHLPDSPQLPLYLKCPQCGKLSTTLPTLTPAPGELQSILQESTQVSLLQKSPPRPPVSVDFLPKVPLALQSPHGTHVAITQAHCAFLKEGLLSSLPL